MALVRGTFVDGGWLLVDNGEAALRSFGQPSTENNQPTPQLLRKEKDEASLPICFRPGSFMPSFSFCGR
jgi:hypothetical protein